MSVVGFDIGNENCIVGVARQRGIDVILNDESSRETPAMVSFGEKQRFLGTAAAATSTMNPRNTISQVKRLIGRKFKDPEVQKDLRLLPFHVSEGPDGGPLINVQYKTERCTFMPTQILGMILYNLKTIAEKALSASVVDCVIAIPVYFSELQRRAYLDAATIAGLRPLRLLHETTAAALAYGIYKSDLPNDNEPFNVAFVDIGHASLQVCVVAFRKGHLQVLGQAWDRNLGGRDFDEVLFEHFVEKFKREQRLDVASNMRASQRLRAACEKMKKVLSANAEASLNIECLMDEKDVRGYMTREDFEHLAVPILERVRIPCERVLVEANMPLERIAAVEVIGSGSRIPAVLKIVAAFFGREPSRTLNASECIARGCALQCAMLSPTFKVRDFEVRDSFPFPIALSWKGHGNHSIDSGGASGEPRSIVFAKGSGFPSAKLLTFYRTGTFHVDSLYASTGDLSPGTPFKIGTYQIGPLTPSKAEKATVKIKIRLNMHGILTLENANLIEEEEEEIETVLHTTRQKDGQQESKEIAGAVPMDTDTQKSACAGLDHQDPNHIESNDQSQQHGADNTSSDIEAKSNKMDVEQHEIIKKKKTRKIDVPFHEVIFGALTPHELQRAVEKEYDMALQDRVMEETKEKKNAVETYVYEMRNKLSEILQQFTTDREREELATKLQQTEFWLYEDGEDESKGVYMAKLAELKKLGDPFVERQREDEARGATTRDLLLCIDSYRDAATLQDPKYDHIGHAEKEKVLLECKKVEEWLKMKKLQQDALSKTNNPVLLVEDMRRKIEHLDRICKPIMAKAKPLPASTPCQQGGRCCPTGEPAKGPGEPPPTAYHGKEPFNEASSHGFHNTSNNDGSNNATMGQDGFSPFDIHETTTRGHSHTHATCPNDRDMMHND